MKDTYPTREAVSDGGAATPRARFDQRMQHCALAAGQVISRRAGRGWIVEVESGLVWLTDEHGHGDILLEPGESFEVDTPGVVVAQGLAESSGLRFVHPR